MPIYEYQCEECEKATEAIQKLDEPPLTICPHCGGALRKLMSAPSFQFKGTGWYVTDYGGKSGGADKEGGKSSSSNESSSKKKTESSSSSGDKGSKGSTASKSSKDS